MARLVLVMRSAGVDGAALRATLGVFHPETVVPKDLDAMPPETAAARLAQAGLGA
jgi:hypothetical protein